MQTLNVQPSKPPDYSAAKLKVHSIWLTLQGEGPYAGEPAVFVRFAYCNLTCRSCDTQYSDQETEYDPHDLAEAVYDLKGPSNLVVLTGGEPMRQPITGLVEMLLADGMRVQLETNGTCWPPDFISVVSDATLVCSPKTPKIHVDALAWVDHWKYVMRHDQVAEDGLPSRSLGMPLPPCRPPAHVVKRNVWLQPEDSGDEATNKLNLQACIDSCLKHGWRLSLQQHKLIGVP